MVRLSPFYFLSYVFLIRLILLICSLSETQLFLLRSLFFVDVTPEMGAHSCASESLDLRYHNSSLKTFDKKWMRYLCRFGLLTSGQKNSEYRKLQPVFVTAFSENHFEDGYNFLAQFSASLVRENLTNVTLYLYDLGLKRSRREQILRKFGWFITIRQFPFHHYPPYVAKLKEYRWKPLIVADVLRHHGSLWWMDSSVRVQSIRNMTPLYSECSGMDCHRYPLTFPFHASHSIFAATVQGMYDYFPISRNEAIRTETMGATVFHLFRTPKVMKEVMKWWVLCALEKDCMAPVGHSLHCDWGMTGGDRHTQYAQCHRYDQSALNILVANANNYDVHRYWKSTDCLAIDKMQ